LAGGRQMVVGGKREPGDGKAAKKATGGCVQPVRPVVPNFPFIFAHSRSFFHNNSIRSSFARLCAFSRLKNSHFHHFLVPTAGKPLNPAARDHYAIH